MSQNREWKLSWSWKLAAVQLAVAIAVGKILSAAFHLNWIASSLCFLALAWFAIALKSRAEESLSYFNPETGTFTPRFQKSSRTQIFATYMAISIMLGVLGFLVQIYA